MLNSAPSITRACRSFGFPRDLTRAMVGAL
jgi:hypothetical protein